VEFSGVKEKWKKMGKVSAAHKNKGGFKQNIIKVCMRKRRP